MTAKQFKSRLRTLLHKDPFEPFVVEYEDGRRFWVDCPYVAFNDGAASFQGSNRKSYLFSYRNVRQFLVAKLEPFTD